MFFAQYYLDCLSQASYMIADEVTGRAVVVDPRRDVSEYLTDAEAHGFTIEAVLNTHFHADFLAGHLELTARTGAWIGYGQRAEAEYSIRKLTDGQHISLGDVQLQILETPGHTPESISILVYEHKEDSVPYGVLTGDALFIGDVGRPDLLASIGVTADELGRMLYDTVQNKLMGLPDAVRVFPAHGAGSACGKNLSTQRQSTIGEQRAANYACRPMSEERFVELVTAGQPSAPAYFVHDAILNRKEHGLFDAAVPPRPLSVEEFLRRRAAGAVVIDARSPQDFAPGHLRGSVNVPADGRFAEQTGMVVGPEQEVVVVAPQDREEEVVTRPRPDRLRQGCRLSARARGRLPRAGRRDGAGEPPDRRRTAPASGTTRNRRWFWTCATPASARRASSRARSTSRWPNSPLVSTRSQPAVPWSSTARAATAPPSPPACCATRAAPMSPTCSADTAPGPARPAPAGA